MSSYYDMSTYYDMSAYFENHLQVCDLRNEKNLCQDNVTQSYRQIFYYKYCTTIMLNQSAPAARG